jgi:cytosine/adenosine deaminase-related metal-dependent hydrolase
MAPPDAPRTVQPSDPGAVLRFYADLAWTGTGPVRASVLLEVQGGRITRVEWDLPSAPADAIRLRGLVLPGLANVHSHAFHRALRGHYQRAGDFWS